MDNHKLKIGLALGAGGARGLAHLGVLEVFERENIKIDIIAGTSIGSLMGGLYACDLPLKYLKGLAGSINWDQITDVTFPRRGLIKGEKLLTFLEILTQKKDISDLKIPFAAIACDIRDGKHIIIDKGPLAGAIRASTAIPGVYEPYQFQGKLLVDGGILDRVPVSTVKKMGADVVIAVDINYQKVEMEINNIFDVLISTFDIMQTELATLKPLDADVVIKPYLPGISTFDLDKAEKCIKSGYKAAEESLEYIESLIKERRE